MTTMLNNVGLVTFVIDAYTQGQNPLPWLRKVYPGYDWGYAKDEERAEMIGLGWFVLCEHEVEADKQPSYPRKNIVVYRPRMEMTIRTLLEKLWEHADATEQRVKHRPDAVEQITQFKNWVAVYKACYGGDKVTI